MFKLPYSYTGLGQGLGVIKMDCFNLMAAQLLLHLHPEHVEWCGDYCETVFIEEQRPVVFFFFCGKGRECIMHHCV